MQPSIRQETAQPVDAACNWSDAFDVVIIGGGSAGIGVTASLLRRRPSLRIAIIEPSDRHYYQPAWTLVGGGVFDVTKTVQPMADVIPEKAQWVRGVARRVDAVGNFVELEDGRQVGYQQLIVCPGLRLAWERIEGLEETLGKNGVTSNYRFDLAPYTWSLVQELKGGKALFTQPPMPIKCAGAPQKAMYLSCDEWLRAGRLNDIEVEFNTCAPVLFGVSAFVPPLMEYVKRYDADLVFNSNLVRVDGENRVAYFDVKHASGEVERVAKPFDMLHVAPPQVAPAFIAESSLADAAGWCEVDHTTLQHPRYPNIFGLGDACSSPNAKTAAAVRKQIVVVAENLLAAREHREFKTFYDGYGSCPLTVERGKVILAEFGFGGKLLPTFKLDPTVPRFLAWLLKARFLPWFYWHGFLKGREWLAGPGVAD
ncbi:sulfide:quinone oxidoreductase [Nitrosospira multiformis]|uniref:Sulfide:quinone oxidoreductase n=1 Tax=Nitrosospira multiformis TaxID=1231 RepID=A0A2T5IGT9_9PROT|nr:FAD/NAD(P)-binding oxidoreductase [Nitrosospira multiformis]PTQ83022.1 sulfide:quinone oxidoreductase [Nitrosospira multiformis]